MATTIQSDVIYNRENCSILVCSMNSTTNNLLRQALKSLGFTTISTAQSHLQGLKRTETRAFSHILFDAPDSDMPARQFVEKMMEINDELVLIAVSSSPQVDDVFSLLSAGARGFIVVPFTADSVESSLVQGSDGAPLSEAVLQAPDRNTALVGVLLNNLYRVAVLKRQAREFTSAARELERAEETLSRSSEMTRMCSEGGPENIVDYVVDGCIQRAKTASTRLGRTRRKLKLKRELGLEGATH